MKIIKQNLGMDVDSKTLKVSFQVLESNLSIKVKGSRTFKNTAKGFMALEEWLDKKRIEGLDLYITMEATGVYYENVAYYFESKDSYVVHVVLPNTSNAYLKSLNLKSKTDEIDAKGLGQMGEGASHQPNARSLNRYKKRIDFIKKQIKSIEKELEQVVDRDGGLRQRIDHVCTAKGVGFITAIGIVAEFNGFILFKNRNQIVSYAGYDVIARESGTSIKGKTKISKKGNSYVRQMLYMAAMSAAKNEEHHKAYYNRIVSKTGIKMKANVAIQRKLLLLIYTLFSKNVPYDPDHYLKTQKRIEPKNKWRIDPQTTEVLVEAI